MGLVKKLYGLLGLRYLRKKFITASKIKYYNRRKDSIIKRIREQKHLTVVFFPMNLSMWKYDNLVSMLLHNQDVTVHIVPLLLPTNSTEYNKKLQNELREYFTQKGFPFIDAYNFDTNQWFDPKTLNPDVIYYIQPYNQSHKLYKLEHFWDKTLFMYSPYGIVVEYLEGFYNTLFLNIAHKLFYPTVFSFNDAKELAENKGENVVVTGYPSEDLFRTKQSDFRNVWKQNDEEIKRVIWAPHHSINSSDTLSYSTFLQVADQMVELCKNYNGKVQFVFKPHPVLKTKLYALEGWGQERTDRYYALWADMPNSSMVDGDYVDLFQTSDAMIHDCSSFTVEYLYVNKPVMYLSKPNHLDVSNELGRICYNQHYHGETIDAVKDFIENVVVSGDDVMKTQRTSFVLEHLTAKGGTVAENMYKETISLIE